MTQNDLLMGIDVGTTSVKGTVYTVSGQRIFMKSLPYPTISGGQPGWVEQNPSDWLACIKDICAEATQTIEFGQSLGVPVSSSIESWER